ncbi:dihydrodipicolinate synthase family protein [Pandoraea terrae]|uniref:Dihydrodipicolinate synthase family protein n=1 Tax=Pandoraea terrae TaxID=1537710 RepID=A0A5E4XUB8_9BURK|nr:dihydrodipicolinate synthase family protein [Pandoraea terrae]VVE39685.1 dihydrodipicolinate synthase family protein [Pandoraea terrae]
MSHTYERRVFAPVITPFKGSLAIDTPRFAAFCRWLIGQGAGLAVFGTNSEANSLSLAERRELLDYLIQDGIDPFRLLPGTGACALPDAIELTAHAAKLNCYGVLMLPPFYYTSISDDGLFRYYAEVIEAVGSSRLRVFLYHIPQFTGVPISHALIERLVAAYPRTVVGIKDSSGDWSNTETMLQRFPGFQIFPASEALLERALPLGAAGCISATANIQPGGIATLLHEWGTPGDAGRQARVSAIRAVAQRQPMIAALKHVVAHFTLDAAWRTVRPPLTCLGDAEGAALIAQLTALDFSMPAAERLSAVCRQPRDCAAAASAPAPGC